jgi:leucyl-tRNA synthetase
MTTHGADTARWFMLSDSPPERDVIWTEAGAEGAHRFIQRVWRLVGEAASAVAVPGAGAPPPNAMSDDATALRRAAHKTLKAVGEHFSALRFNVAVARIYELVNTVSAALAGLDKGGAPTDAAALGWAIREALELVVQMMAPVVPHVAEEAWQALGHSDMLAVRAWPTADAALISDDTLVLPVQVNGRKRAELTVPVNAPDSDIEAAALALEPVVRALEGRLPRKVIVVPKRIVNVVV